MHKIIQNLLSRKLWFIKCLLIEIYTKLSKYLGSFRKIPPVAVESVYDLDDFIIKVRQKWIDNEVSEVAHLHSST